MYNLKAPSTWHGFIKELKNDEVEFTETLTTTKLTMAYIGFGGYRAMLQVG
jgi:hypothetical protein